MSAAAMAATEAQRLYSISLTKIAKSRHHRGGVSLHKNLLVATVLQKARFQIYMEDVHHMWQTNSDSDTESSEQKPEEHHVPTEYDEDSDDEDTSTLVPSSEHDYADLPPSPSDLCTPASDSSTDDKENQLPSDNVSEPTYLDLDSRVRETGSPTINVVFRERSNCESSGLKRRHGVSEWETEEAVLSILPKRAKRSTDGSTSTDDDVFTGNNDSASSSGEEDDGVTSMEIDRITSLVSIFSFGGLALESPGKLARTVSTPDLCSAQAKECSDPLQQQRPSFIAMTV